MGLGPRTLQPESLLTHLFLLVEEVKVKLSYLEGPDVSVGIDTGS